MGELSGGNLKKIHEISTLSFPSAQIHIQYVRSLCQRPSHRMVLCRNNVPLVRHVQLHSCTCGDIKYEESDTFSITFSSCNYALDLK